MRPMTETELALKYLRARRAVQQTAKKTAEQGENCCSGLLSYKSATNYHCLSLLAIEHAEMNIE